MDTEYSYRANSRHPEIGVIQDHRDSSINAKSLQVSNSRQLFNHGLILYGFFNEQSCFSTKSLSPRARSETRDQAAC